MSATIDQRIVEMQFNNSQFEKNIDASLKSIDALKKGLDFDKSAKGLETLQKAGNSFSLASIANSVEHISEKFTALGILGVRIMQRIADAAITAGKNLAKSLSVDQISAGFSKYSEKIASVQTILNSTGKSLDEVNGYLEELMWFSDETSYGFTDMTAALSQMTSSGGKIENLIPLITGVANATAFAGKGAAEFSRVMFNLNQSYGAGYLTMMDWKSVSLAGVGSQQLKQTLIDTAVAMGKIKKDEVTVSNFDTTLQKRWATTEVMEKAFGKFAEMSQAAYDLVKAGKFETAAEAMASLSGQYSQISEQAFSAAQQAKTFTEAIDATKDAVSSGWMKSFELIFGDLEESKILWTDLTAALWEVFASGSYVRNDLLAGWKELGGREDLIQGITDILGAFWSVVVAVGDAMHDIFPKTTVDDLVAISKGVKEFGARLKALLNYKELLIGQSTSLWTIFDQPRGATSVVSSFFGELTKGATGEDVKKLQEKLKALGYDLGPPEVDGIFGSKTQAALKEYQKKMGLTETGIFDSATYEKLFGVVSTESDVWANAGDSVTVFSDALQKLGRIAKGAFAVLHIGWQILQFVGNVLKHLGKIISPVVNAFIDIAAYVADAHVAFDKWLESSGLFSDWLAKVEEFLQPVAVWFEKAGASILKFFGFGDEASDANSELMTFPKLWAKIVDGVKATGIWDKLVEAWGKVKTSFKEVWPVIKGYYDKFKGILGDKFQWLIGKIVESVPKVVEGIGNFFVWVLDFINPVIQKIPAAIRIVKNFFAAFFDRTDASGNKIPGIFTKIKDFFVRIWDSIKGSERIQKAWNKVKTFFSNLWTSLFDRKDGTGNKIPGVFSKIKNFFVWLWDTVKGSEKIQSAWKKVKTFFSNLWISLFDRVDESGNKVAGVFTKLKDFFVGLWDAIKNSEKLQLAWGKFKSFFSGIWDAVKAVFSGNSDESGSEKGLTLFEKIGSRISIGWERISSIFGTIFGDVGEWLKAFGADGIIGLILTVFGIKSIVSIMSSFKTITNGFQAITEAFTNKGVQVKKVRSLSTIILEIAAAIGIIMGAIYLLGTMTPAQLVQGGIALAVIVGVFVGIIVAMRKLSKDTKVIANIYVISKSLMDMAIGLGVIAAAIYVLGKMDPAQLATGAVSMIGILVIMGAFMFAMSKLGATKFEYAGIVGLAGAIAILALVARMIGRMDPWKFYTGLLGMSMILGLLGGVMAAMSAASKQGAVSIKLSGILKMVVAVGILALIARMIGGMDSEKFGPGLGWLTLMVLGLGALMFALSAVSKGQVSISFKGIVNLAIGVGILVGIAWLLSKSKINDVEPKVGSLIAMVGAISLLTLVLNKSSMKVDFKKILSMAAGLSIVMVTFGFMMRLVKGIDPKSMLSFATSLSILMIAFAVAIPMSAAVGVGGAAKGALALTAGLAILLTGMIAFVTILGAIDRAFGGGLSHLLEAGGKVLRSFGKAIGSFIGGLSDGILGTEQDLGDYGDDLAVYGESLAAFDASTAGVTKESVSGAVEASKLISQFVNGLPKMGGVKGWWEGDQDFGAFADDLLVYAQAIGVLGPAVTIMAKNENIVADTGKAIEVSKILHEFFSALEMYPIEIYAVEGYVTAAAQLSTDMNLFGIGIRAFAAGVSGFAEKETIDADAQKAIDIATIVHDFFEKLVPTTINPNAAKGYNTAAATLSTDMGLFGVKIKNFASNVRGISSQEKLEDDTNKAVAVAQIVHDFFVGLLPTTPNISLLDQYNVASTGLLPAIEKFGTTMSGFAKVIAGFAKGSGEADATSAVAAAQTVKDFLDGLLLVGLDAEKDSVSLAEWEKAYGTGKEGEAGLAGTLFGNITAFGNAMSDLATGIGGLSDLDLDDDLAVAKSYALDIKTFCNDLNTEVGSPKEFSDILMDWLDGDDASKTVFDRIGQMGDAFGRAKTGFENLSTGTFEEDAKVAKRTVTLIAGLLMWLSSDAIVIDNRVGSSYVNNFNITMSQMEDMSSSIATFNNNTKDINTDRFVSLGEAVADIVDSVKSLASYEDIGAITTFQTSLSTLVDLLSPKSDLALDPSKFTAALADSTAYEDITEFTSDVQSSLDDNLPQLTESMSAFNSAGSDLAAQLNYGVGAKPGGGYNTTGAENLCNALIDVLHTFEDDFESIGSNFSIGAGKGIRKNIFIAVGAVSSLGHSVIAELKRVLGIHSPSKEGMYAGMYLDKGVAKGLSLYRRLVTRSAEGVGDSAINPIRDTLSNLSSVIDSNVDATPVIRPVVDLSNVADGARAIGGLLSTGRTISVDSIQSKRLAGSITLSKGGKAQNGSPSPGSTPVPQVNPPVSFEGAVFHISGEQDARVLASELAHLINQGQRALGAPLPNY